jgi:hypothetical protein
MRFPFPRPAPALALARVWILLLAALASTPVAAQTPAGIVSRAASFDPSVQTSGIGGASAAVFWLGEPNEWGNPAALGTVRGVRYVHEETALRPLVLDYDELTSDRVLAGAIGIGVSLAGKPFESLGGHRLEYGSQTITDGIGGTLTFRPYEEVRSFSVGVSVLDLLSNVASIGFRDRVTLAVGHTWKDLRADLGVDPTTLQRNAGEGESRDRGALVRIAPLDEIGDDLWEPRDDLAGRLELGAGYSERNYEDPGADDLVRVLEREETLGLSGQATLLLPTRIRRGWFWDFATPTLAFTFAWERTEGETWDVEGSEYDLTRSGGEVRVMDLFAFRHGRVDNPGGLEGTTWGAGVTLQYRKAVGVRFDWARVPWEEDETLDRFEFGAFLDLLQFDTSGGL